MYKLDKHFIYQRKLLKSYNTYSLFNCTINVIYEDTDLSLKNCFKIYNILIPLLMN